MSSMAPQVTVLSGGAAPAAPPRTQLWTAYEHYRLGRQGDLVSEKTLETYVTHVEPFLTWAGDECGFTVLDSHKALLTFFRWARTEGYEFDGRILELKRPRVPKPEADVYHMSQLRAILTACNRRVPQEELMVRILVGSGVRASELCGLALVGPDGLSDVMTDSMARGRVELRVRWDGGAKGKKSRRVPITPKLAAAIKAYQGRHRREVEHGALLINQHGRPYQRYGVDAIMDRLQRRVGFRVHAHAFRHTFATIVTKLGWNFEHLRAAMGHAEYKELQRYVRLATERDLGSRRDWLDFIAANPATEWA
ncbi:MAG: site-specific integrase [Chloroflexi bacterium]|nr:MAG: site-specific integrase [Chloroflexota bacterium]